MWMPWRNVARSVLKGWEFSLRDYGQSALRRFSLSKSKVELPANYCEHDICIKHLDSGIAFRFSAYDAITKLVEEKQTGDPLASDLPSYDTPLLPLDDEQYDSAYVGRIVIEKPDEETQNIDPIWEDIDRNTLSRQLKWSRWLQIVNDVPVKSIYPSGEGPSSFVNRKKLKKLDRAEKRRSLVNFVCPLYDNRFDLDKDGLSSCFFNLVIFQNLGWFVYLKQHFWHMHGAERTREMTMHCPFESNIVFREIVEEQSIDFEEILSMNTAKKWEDRMGVHFHDTKQLRVQGGSVSHAVRDARQYSSSPVGESTTQPPVDLSAHLEDLNVPDTTIESIILPLFACKSGDQMRLIEDKFGCRIQIIPLFKHPCNPEEYIANGFEVPKHAPTKVYKFV